MSKIIVGLDIDGPTVRSMSFFFFVYGFGKKIIKIFKINNKELALEKYLDGIWYLMEKLQIFFSGTKGSKQFFKYLQENEIYFVFISARRKRFLAYTIKQVERITNGKNCIILENKSKTLKELGSSIDIFVDDIPKFLDLIKEQNSNCKTFHFLLKNEKYSSDIPHIQIKKLTELIPYLCRFR